MRTTILIVMVFLLSACGGGGSGSGAGSSFDGVYRGSERLTFVDEGVMVSVPLTLRVASGKLTITDDTGLQWQASVAGDGSFSAANSGSDGCATVTSRYQGKFAGNRVSGNYFQSVGCESAIRGSFSAQRTASRAPNAARQNAGDGFKRLN